MRLYNVHSSGSDITKNKASLPNEFLPKQFDEFDEWKATNVRWTRHPAQSSAAYEGDATLRRHVEIRSLVKRYSESTSPTTATADTADKTQFTPPLTRVSPDGIVRTICEEDILDTLPALRDLDDILKRARALARKLEEDISDASSLSTMSDLDTKDSFDIDLASDDYLVEWDDIPPNLDVQDALFLPFRAAEELCSSCLPRGKTVPFRELVNCTAGNLHDQILKSSKESPAKAWTRDHTTNNTNDYVVVRANLRKVGEYKTLPTAESVVKSDCPSRGLVEWSQIETTPQARQSPLRIVPEKQDHDYHPHDAKNSPTSALELGRALSLLRPMNQSPRLGQYVFRSSATSSTPDASNLTSRRKNAVDNSWFPDDSRKILFPSPADPGGWQMGRAQSPLKGIAQVSIHDEPKPTKYSSTLDTGVQHHRVENRMQADRCDPQSLYGEMPAAQLVLNPHDDSKYSKYVRMIKMGLPMGAVKNATTMDGFDPSVLDGDTTNTVPTQTLKSDTVRRFRIRWEAINNAGSKTVWTMAKDDPAVNIQLDEVEVERLFRSDLSSHPPLLTTRDHEQATVKVIDPKRANNGGIALARIQISYSDIARAIDHFDQDAITPEQIRAIINFLPAKEERAELQSFLIQSGSSINMLCECEKFMVAMTGIEHAKRKLSAIQFMQSFGTCLEDLRRDARIVQKACDEIMGSSRLRKVLGVILSVGNRLNQAGINGKEPVGSITLDSLMQLNQAKAFDRQTTFLRFVVASIRKSNASLINFKDDMPSVCKVEKTQWSLVMLEMQRLEKGLDEVRKIALHHCLIRAGLSSDDASSVSSSGMALDREVVLLQTTSVGRFTLDACVRMAVLVNDADKLKDKVYELFQYFGEDCKATTQPDMVFYSLFKFVKDFDSALEEVIVQEKATARETRGVPIVRDATRSFDDGEMDSQKRCGSGIFAALGEIKKKKSKATLRRWRRGRI